MIDQKESIKRRAVAQSRARNRLTKAHYAEYIKYYQEECARLGLNTNPSKLDRIALLEKEQTELRRKLGITEDESESTNA